MSKQCIAYIDRIREGQELLVDLLLEPHALALDNTDLQFTDSICVKGCIYLAEDHLIIQVSIKTGVYLPCSICNELVKIDVSLKNIYMTHPLEEIRTHEFDFTEDLREAILLEIPSFAECNKGRCPQRANMESYLKSQEKEKKQKDEDTYYPFNDLDQQLLK